MILPFLRRKKLTEIKEPPHEPTPDPRREFLEGDTARNLEFKLERWVWGDGNRSMPFESMQVSLLMDLRDELRKLNKKIEMVEQNTRKTHRTTPLNLVKLGGDQAS